MSRPVAIGLLCKAPRPGVSKTRLMPVVGAERSAALSRAFLIDTAAAVRRAATATQSRAVAIYAPADAGPEIEALLPDFDRYMPQASGSLGTMMQTSLTVLLADHDAAFLIGSDVPTVPDAILRQAIERLADPAADTIIAPSEDGGYFLIGMRSLRPALFAGIAWSTDRVLAETLAAATRAGIQVDPLPAWYDVDDAEGLARLTADLARDPALAPETRATLERVEASS
jgi:hypothetical protein